MIYRKLKRTWSNGYANYIPRFQETFPELSKISSEEMADRLQSLNMDFYYVEKTPVNPLIRLTIPFALLLFVLMFISLPFLFIITGQWGYSLGKKNRVHNWFKSLRLVND